MITACLQPWARECKGRVSEGKGEGKAQGEEEGVKRKGDQVEDEEG